MLLEIHFHPTRSIPFTVSMLLMVCMMSLTSCQKDEDHLEPIPYQVLESILSTNDITVDDVKDSMIDMLRDAGYDERMIAPYEDKIQMASLRARKYTAYTISYHTVDPNGVPVIASGVVYYPKSGTPRGVIEAVSYNPAKGGCASKQIINLQQAQGMAGFIVLVPDQIGCGTTESQPIPLFYNENVARVSADFRLAATELVRNVHGRDMPQWTLITGISLAASGVWALARYYHMHPEMGVNVNQIWMAAGVYNNIMTFEHLLSTRYSDFAYIPNGLYSLNHYAGLGLNLEDMFTGELKEHYMEWCTGYVSLFELSERLGPNLDEYLNLDFFKEENPDYLRLKACIEGLTIPNDWIPSCPVHIYHGRNDNVIPFMSSQELVDYLRSVGAKVDFKVIEGDHTDACVEMEIDLIEHLYK